MEEDIWVIQIISNRCPYKTYPTHTKNGDGKGYCNILDGDKECNEENCPNKIN